MSDVCLERANRVWQSVVAQSFVQHIWDIRIGNNKAYRMSRREIDEQPVMKWQVGFYSVID